MMKKKIRSEFLGVHVTLETKTELEIEANRRDMSVSALVSRILDKYLEGLENERSTDTLEHEDASA